MSVYGKQANGNGNGKGASASSAVTGAWDPESPFLSDLGLALPTAAPATAAAAVAIGATVRHESPFLSEYSGETEAAGPRAQLFAEVLSELSDTEFNEALEDLVNEASAVAEERFSSETADPATQRRDAERAVRAYLEPIGEAAEEMLEALDRHLGRVDLASASDGEVERLFEQFAPPATDLSPVAEQFLGGLLKKAKGALNVVKRVASYLPQNLILGRLKALVRPLLERVLRMAIDRIPASLQPIAKQLAKRFLGIDIAEAADEMEDAANEGESASADPAQLEQELDTQIAGYVVDGENFEQESAVEQAVASQGAASSDALGELAQARKRFAERITTLQPDAHAQPVMEEFIPAILAALKMGIQIIGRPRVVKFLAGLVANLIQKYIGQDQAMALSGALVDAGLRSVDLETNGGSTRAPGYALGATVEDTIARLVQEAPEAAWNNSEMLAAYTFEAFQQAATAHFPDSEIRDELHEASTTSGVWVGIPQRAPHKTYKRYSRVLEVTITPQAANAVRTFGGISLRAFLADRLGITTNTPIRARAHLFEAIPGTTLGLIAMHERTIRGLGTVARAGRSLIHPLTPEAAAALFGEPGLARPVSARYLARRAQIAVGQRFYYLEIPNARVRFAPRDVHVVRHSEVAPAPTRPARSSQPKIIIDLLKREIRIFLYFSETDAQSLTTQLEQHSPIASLLATLKGTFSAMFHRVETNPRGVLRIIHETAPTESYESSFVASIKRMLARIIGNKAEEWVLDAIGKELGTQYDRIAADIVKATGDDADGITVRLSLQIPVLEKLRALYKPTGWFGISGIVKAFRKAKVTSYQLTTLPGFAVQ